MQTLTPESLRRMNRKHGWGMCTREYARFKRAFPEGIEVNRRNLTKLKKDEKFSSMVKWVGSQICFFVYYKNGKCICADYRNNPARYVRNLSKLIKDAQPKVKAAAAK
jgi:hypothetical protein